MKRYYKYTKWCCPNKRILTDSEIYFSSGENFNDPFDCTVLLNYDEQHWTELIDWFKSFMHYSEPKIRVKEKYDHLPEEQQARLLVDQERRRNKREQLQSHYYNLIGIFSVSRVRDSVLMWSHYSDSHKGLCVGFNEKKLRCFFDKLSHGQGADKREIRIFPVEYVPDMDFPELPPGELTHVQRLAKPLLQKHSEWIYEREHRAILLQRTNERITLENDIICEVILGCKMVRRDREEILEVLGSHTSHVQVYQAKPMEDRFGLDFESVDY